MSLAVVLALAAVVLSLALMVTGLLTLRRGWIMPWWRGRIIRPTLFGSAQLVVAVATMCQFVANLGFADSYVPRYLFIGSGLALVLTGLLLISLAQRPGRTR